MHNINKKQKIILIILAILAIFAISYYVYAEDKSFLEIEEQNQLQIEENNLEEKSEDEYQEQEIDGNAKNTEANDTIIIHVSGAVNKEGIIKLSEGNRIADAIEKAGGFKEDAYTKEINLAYIVEDGMKIHIPSQKEQTEKETSEQQKYVTKESGAVVAEKSNTQVQGEKSEQKVNINTATQTELETLPGIGPSTAMKIIKYREENGQFKKAEEIKEVSGIGNNKYQNIKDLITVK